MRHLSVIGLGAMGSALATTLLKAAPPRVISPPERRLHLTLCVWRE